MAVSDGTPVNAANTNAAFISRTADSDTTGKVGLKNTELESGNIIENTQKLLNQILDAQGNAGEDDANAKVYSSNNVVADGDDRKVAIGKLDAEFNATTGHSHDGVNSPLINASNLSGFNAFEAAYQGKDIVSASGTTFDVSSDFSGDTAGGDATTEGVITDAPNNYVSIIETSTGTEIEDGTGKRVFGRITESAGTWTLSFYVNDAGVETAHNLSSTDISIFYREVFGPANPKPTITADVASFDSLNVTADIVDASATQAGKVSTTTQSFAGQKTFTTGADVNGDPVVTETAAQTVTNKDIDGGTASNTNRLTVPKNTTANLTALTRKEATVFYDTDQANFFGDDGTNIIPLGGGGAGGSLDYFYQESMESIATGDVTVTGTWTKALETTNPINGDTSFKLTQASGSSGAKADFPNITLDDNEKDTTIGLQGRYTYDGNNDEISVVAYDVTNSQILGRLYLKASTSARTFRLIFNTVSTTATINYYFEVMTENIGAILLVDNIEMKVNPLPTIESVESQVYRISQAGTAITDRNGEVEFNLATATIENDGANLITVADDSGNTRTTFTANSTVDVTVSATLALNTASERVQFFVNGSVVHEGTWLDTTQRGVSATATLRLNNGDILTIGSNGVIVSTATINYVTIHAQATSANVVFEGQSSEFDWQDTGETFSSLVDAVTTAPTFGTLAIDEVYYARMSGNVYKFKYSIDQTSAGTAGSGDYLFTLPKGFSFDSGVRKTTAAITNLQSSEVSALAIGNTVASNGTDVGYGKVIPYDDTRFRIVQTVFFSAQNVAGSSGFPFSNTNQEYSIEFDAPIANAKASDVIYSVPVTNLVENVYSAKIDYNAGSPIIQSQNANFIESVSNIATGQMRVNFVSGFFDVIPSVASSAVAVSGGDHIVNIDNLSLTGFDVVFFNSAGAVITATDIHIVAQRQGADYRAPKGYFLGNLSQPVAYIRDVKPSGTSGGSGVSASYVTRDLNDLQDPNGIVTNLSFNQFTLQEGTYVIEADAPAYFVNRHKAKLVQDPNGTPTDLIFGTSNVNGSAVGGDISFSKIRGYITITSQQTFEIQHYVQAAGTDRLGLSSNIAGDDEVYTIVKITKLR